MGKINQLPKDLKTVCYCGHSSGMHISSRSVPGKKKSRLVEVPPDETRCAICKCPRFIQPPATWEVLMTDPFEGHL